MTAALDGVVRDGRHHMQIRVYYEDTDLGGVLSHLAWQSRAPLRRDRADCHPWGGGNIQRSHLVHRLGSKTCGRTRATRAMFYR
jgi:hypothetical protein